MNEAPQFFLPEVTPDNQEAAYAELARWCHRPIPGPRERIYSITYVNHREEWTATVGERLRGTRPRPTRRGNIEQIEHLADPAMVLAIFPGSPFVVVTNAGNVVRSAWENPFFAGNPRSVTFFSVPQ